MNTKIYCILFAILATALTVVIVLGMAYFVASDMYKFAVSGFTGAILTLWYEFFKGLLDNISNK